MILAIESSCDESALALFDPESGELKEWIHTQIDLHQEYGGIVPDLASREHLDNFPFLLERLLDDWTPQEGDMVVVTSGPGLAGCLALGISLAKAIGVYFNLPVYGANHLRGHAWSPFVSMHASNPSSFEENLQNLLPHLGLIVSGGNTLLFSINESRRIEILGETVDDAAGEALDKGAKLLGLSYPGGPRIEKLASKGDRAAYDFPRAFSGDRSRRFSFSGLKTSLRYKLEKAEGLDFQKVLPDLCASYQEAVFDALSRKCKQVLSSSDWSSIGLSGGVSNNRRFREIFSRLGDKYSVPVYIAEPRHTGDNAGMIAFAAYADPDHLIPDEHHNLKFYPDQPLSSENV